MKHLIQIEANNKQLSNAQLETLARDAGYEASSKLKNLWEDAENPNDQFRTVKLNITIQIEAE